MPLACPRCGVFLASSGDPPSFCSSCGQALNDKGEPTVDLGGATGPAAPPDSSGAPAAVGGYRLLRRLGRGGMGEVYEAEALDSGRRVALKWIGPRYAGSAEALERFRREGRLASAIVHPRCVFVVAAEEDQGRPYIVLELMPGSTLNDLVQQRGQLPLDEAIRYVLDVIDGLLAVHAHGIVHRDVKPSNCFLDAEGRAKVGDFGLARTLLTGADLTQSGRFLGTPLFASPEQLKGETVDQRTDVYAVAATLYYLLTGQAPFQGTDPAAVAARVASEAAPSMRLRRPDVPAGLDRVVRRGLERDRRRRWRDLDALRAVLVRFLPARPSLGGVGLRLVAFLIDYPIVLGLWLLLKAGLRFLGAGPLLAGGDIHLGIQQGEFLPNLVGALLYYLLVVFPGLVYFGVPEGLWGCALGKWLLRVRVTRRDDNRPPGLARSLLRTAVFCGLLNLPQLIVDLLPLDCMTHLILTVLASTYVGGGLLVITTMREANGFRGLHDFIAGTQVIRLCWPGRKPAVHRRLARACRDAFDRTSNRPVEMPSTVGPFRVHAAHGWGARGGVLLGEDMALERKVLLWLRPAGAPPLSARRCDLNRPTRLRWLTGGLEAAWRWEAFVAEGGCPLPEVVAAYGPLPWKEARPLFQQLAEELTAACSDQTLPPLLSSTQVWLQPAGRVQLLDMPLSETPAGEPEAVGEQERALSLLGNTAALLLEGRPRPPAATAQPLRVPLPIHAAQMMRRLLGVEQPYTAVDDVQAELIASQDRPTQLGRGRRALHLLVQALMLIAGYLLLCALVPPLRPTIGEGKTDGVGILLAVVIMGVLIFWSAWVRGGPSFALCGIALSRTDDGQPARWQAGLRSLLAWAQGFGMLWLLNLGWYEWYSTLGADPAKAARPDFWFVIEGLVAYTTLAVWLPRRPLHDRIAGTCLVPR
jgi:eukaryotic-like serine/threonine-protein kinase